MRRTSSIETVFPEGQDRIQHMRGRARDLWTGDALSDSRVLSEDEVRIQSSDDRIIMAAEIDGLDAETTSRLVGLRAGGQLRGANADLNPGMKEGGTPLHLLLDDMAVATLVAGWVWSQWWDPANGEMESRHKMEGVCIGFHPGSDALTDDGRPRVAIQNYGDVPPMGNPSDPIGWHAEIPDPSIVSSMRSRFLDVWKTQDGLHVEAGFQDSGTVPGGGRRAVHEYRVHLTADPETLEITSLTADPRILPYKECPAAVHNVQKLVGTRLPELRSNVVQHLKGTLGCTHLNDVLRGLADANYLLKAL